MRVQDAMVAIVLRLHLQDQDPGPLWQSAPGFFKRAAPNKPKRAVFHGKAGLITLPPSQLPSSWWFGLVALRHLMAPQSEKCQQTNKPTSAMARILVGKEPPCLMGVTVWSGKGTPLKPPSVSTCLNTESAGFWRTERTPISGADPQSASQTCLENARLGFVSGSAPFAANRLKLLS